MTRANLAAGECAADSLVERDELHFSRHRVNNTADKVAVIYARVLRSSSTPRHRR